MRLMPTSRGMLPQGQAKQKHKASQRRRLRITVPYLCFRSLFLGPILDLTAR